VKSKFEIVAEISDDVEPEYSSLDGVWQQYASKIGADKFRCTYEEDCAFSGRCASQALRALRRS
jgi:hypothetical protein